MKILHVSTEATWRGGEKQLFLLHSQLISEGIESKLISKRGSVLSDYCRKHHLPYEDITINSAYDLLAAERIKRIASQQGFDLLHIHTSKGHTLATLATIMGLSIPIVLSRRVDFPVKNNLFSHFKYNLKSIKKIICVSDEIKRITSPSIKDQSRLCTVHSGVDIRKFENIKTENFLRKRYGITQNTKLIGNTSALADHKDYYTFIDTATRVHDTIPDTHFFIIGDGPLRASLEAYSKAVGAEHFITFTGFLEDVEKALFSLDLFLFTSKTEGLGTSVLDAMAAGVPIVSTRAGGIPEMIEHSKNGLLCPVADSECLAKSVIEVLKKPSLQKQLTDAATEVLKDFSYQNTARNTIRIYQEILMNN
jgi:glycosyltransferase involved in cell wall biosynthesis